MVVSFLEDGADVASARLVSRTWRARVDGVLLQLSPRGSPSLELVAGRFPNLCGLMWTPRPAELPSLRGAGRFRRLEVLEICALEAPAHSRVDCALLAPLAGSLRRLWLSRMTLDNAQALGALGRLQALDLGWCVCEDAAGPLRRSIGSLAGLRELSLPGALAHPDALAQLPCLERLKLDDVAAADGRLMALLAALRCALRSLSLYCADAPDAARTADVAGALRAGAVALRTLRFLDLMGSAHADERVLRVLPDCAPQLESVAFDVNGYPWTATGAGDVPDVAPLALLPRLTDLTLYSLPLTSARVAALAGCRRLERLALPCCWGLEDEALYALRQLPGLRELSLSGHQLSAWGVGGLVRALPRLRQLRISTRDPQKPIDFSGNAHLEHLVLYGDVALDADEADTMFKHLQVGKGRRKWGD